MSRWRPFRDLVIVLLIGLLCALTNLIERVAAILLYLLTK